MSTPRHEPLWTSDEIAAATGGQVPSDVFAATGVSIDTRTLEPGDLFVALSGARDGHDFIEAALASGASGALASRAGPGPRVIVEDVQAGLEALGLAARARSPALRGAVTGSVGKTSVTQALRAGLALAGPSHGSVKSYNNQIGVPLTLARMPRATQRAVFEIGMNHAGEIEPLSLMVAPDAVCVTTVGPVHTENFADGEQGVARAKAEIFAGLKPGGSAVLNADNRWYALLRDAALQAGAKVCTFGVAEGCDARLLSFTADGSGALARAELDGRPVDIRLRQRGAHWGPNSLAVLLMLEALEVSADDGLAALAGFEPLEGRGREHVVRAPFGAFVLIDESYNANPISMQAALGALGERAAMGRRVAVLTDMLELGPQASHYHAEIADVLECADIDLVFCAGPMMKFLWDALPPTRRGAYALSAADLAPQVAQAVEPGDVVIVKGSNGSKASVVARALEALAAQADSTAPAGARLG